MTTKIRRGRWGKPQNAILVSGAYTEFPRMVTLTLRVEDEEVPRTVILLPKDLGDHFPSRAQAHAMGMSYQTSANSAVHASAPHPSNDQQLRDWWGNAGYPVSTPNED